MAERIVGFFYAKRSLLKLTFDSDDKLRDVYVLMSHSLIGLCETACSA